MIQVALSDGYAPPNNQYFFITIVDMAQQLNFQGLNDDP